MNKKFLFLLMALFVATSLLYADPTEVPLTVKTLPQEGDHPRSPIVTPVFYLDGHTLTASSNTIGSTVELLVENGIVVFSTYIYIEGDINLPASLSGTYTIEVTRGSQAFEGEIELE